MFNAQVAGYTGKQLEGGFVGNAGDGQCFIVLSIEEGSSEESGKNILENIQEAILHTEITSLTSFENTISSQIFKQNLPAHFSLAAGFLHDNSLYVKTVGNGEIYYRRGKDFALLISGDKSASGTVAEYDLAVLTTTSIKKLIGEATDIQTFVDMNAPKDIVEKIQNEEYDEEETGFTAMFVEFTSQPIKNVSSANPNLGINPFADVKHSDPAESVQPKDNPTITPTGSVVTPPISSEAPVSSRTFSKLKLVGSKKIALALSIVLFGILIWSVVFGYERRAAARFDNKVEETAASIDDKLKKAEQEAFLNLETSLQLLLQAKTELSTLKSESEGRNTSDLEEIEKKIQQTEAGIVKKEEKIATEFYDLALEVKSAQGSGMYVENNEVAILDKKNKTIYLLSIDKKSIEKYTATEVADASHVGLYDGTIYFFSVDGGIFRFNTQNKVKNLIKPDPDWGLIVDFEIFNGNLYLLDQSNDDIHKYTPTEDGYSDMTSYLTGTVDFGAATGMSIDSSVYVSTDTSIQKFTRGSVEKFETEFPDNSVNLSGIYTHDEIEQVYTIDKEKSVFYVLEKDGGYIRQIQSSALNNASDFFVNGDSAYILSGSTLYQLPLD